MAYISKPLVRKFRIL